MARHYRYAQLRGLVAGGTIAAGGTSPILCPTSIAEPEIV